MRKLFIYALVGLSLVGCDSSRDSGAAAGTAAIENALCATAKQMTARR